MSAFMIIAGECDVAPERQRALLDARRQFTESLRASGALLDTERLRSSSEGRRAMRRAGATRVEPGPFPGAVGTYWVVEAKDLDAALALARELPTEPDERLEVRPVMKGRYEPAKADRTGKVFAFGVLGSAPNEEAWIRLMDRIDAETQEENLSDEVIAGIRLEAPRTGRTLVNQRGRVVVLDGPFLESREVIGGIFFMRFPSIDEAVSCALHRVFTTLGAAEIREVWRS